MLRQAVLDLTLINELLMKDLNHHTKKLSNLAELNFLLASLNWSLIYCIDRPLAVSLCLIDLPPNMKIENSVPRML